MKRLHGWVVVPCMIAGIFQAHLAGAQDLPAGAKQTPTVEAGESSPADAIAARRAEISKEIAEAQKALAAASEAGGKPPETLLRLIDLLHDTDLSYEQQLGALEYGAELARMRQEMGAELSILRETGPQEKRPYSFLLLDGLMDELESEEKRAKIMDAMVEAAENDLQQAKASLAKEERESRQTKEVVEKKDGPAAALRMEEIESRFARAVVEQQQMELVNQKAMRTLQNLRRTFVREKVEAIAVEAKFGPEDLAAKLAEIDKSESELKQKLEEAKLGIHKSEAKPREKLGLARLEVPWIKAKKQGEAPPPVDAAAAAEVEAYRLGRVARHMEVDLLTKQVKRSATRKRLWNYRYTLNTGAVGKDDLAAWREEARQELERLNRYQDLVASKLRELRKAVNTLAAKIDEAEGAPGVLKWLEEQRDSCLYLIGMHEEEMAGIDRVRRLDEKLLAEIQAESQYMTLGERLEVFWGHVAAVWNFEAFSVEDRSITVSKITRGVLLLVLGFWLSRLISSLIGRRILPRAGVNKSAAAALQTVIFYVLVLMFTLFALHLVNVPLTIFTILGGALAIGVGFGSQHILNNFISGFIILAERPIRIGDLIQIGDLHGTVDRIGARSTWVRTSNNIDIIVPNSTFLQENVINWTLGDTKVRTSVDVGVIYGSPTDEVTRILHQAVREHGKVLKWPDPVVLFAGFGDNSLNFQVYFWIEMRLQIQRKVIESDIRYRIDSLFREAGIVIAFPQRDVHLDAEKPLEVRVLPGPDGEKRSEYLP